MIIGGRACSQLTSLWAAPGQQRWLAGLSAAADPLLQLACLGEVRGVLRLSGPDLIPFLQVCAAGRSCSPTSQPR